MAGPAPPIEWYIARDGKQYGPLTDLEMRKFVELGHLRPSDLVWRYGFPDWRPALAVFPPQPRPQPAPPPQPARHPEQRGSAETRDRAREDQPPSQRQQPSPSFASGPARTATLNTPVAVSGPFDHDDEEEFEEEVEPE